MKPFYKQRPSVGSLTLCLVTCVYLLALTNNSFWPKAFNVFGGFTLSFLMFASALFLLVAAGIVFFSVKYLIKPILIFLIITAAVSSYYGDFFGVVIDKEMLRNAVVTTPQEARHLITLQFVIHVLVYGIIPSALICLVRVTHRSFLATIGYNCAVICTALLVAAGLISANFVSLASNIRNNRDMMPKLVPFAPITSAVGLGMRYYNERGLVRVPIGTDAHLGSVAAKASLPVVTVIVAGETARGMNFSLNGYLRDTNPELRALGVVNYPNTTSCGTATAVSLPCMFSIYPRTEYSDRKARSTNSLLDVLKQAGIDPYWWDNNTGDKGIADLVSFSSFANREDPRYCAQGECQDGVFLDDLDAKLSSITKNTVIVLHQLGSHGPAYYMRYPEEFRRFKPDCRTSQLSDCSRDEIVNAYDNTILYTDHVLASVVGLLQKHSDRMFGAMLYMSDHGESLGEKGLYLHGAPYAFAPEEQTLCPS